MFSSALGVPFLSVMWAPLSIIGALFTIKKRCGIDGIIVYNYRFLEFLVACFGRAVLKVPVLLDLEDI